MSDLRLILSCAVECIEATRVALEDEHEANVRANVQELLSLAAEAQALVRNW